MMNVKVAPVVKTQEKFKLLLRIEGLIAVYGEDGMFSLESTKIPTNLDATALVDSMKEQGLEGRVIDDALEAVHEVIHKDFVTKLFASRVSFQGVA